MAKVMLKNCGVVFDKANHTYELNGKMLQGITGMLQRQLFNSEYEGIPWHIVQQAGKYGSAVHDSCEIFDKNWENDGTQEVQDYISICKEYGFTHEASEYTVSDGKDFASNIDKVFRVNENTFDLADIKTYGKLTADKLEKARWQLSIYAWFFEIVNPKAKVGRLAVIHLRNKQKKDGNFDHISEVIFVDRIPKDIVKELLEAEVEHRQYLNPYDMPEEYKQKEARIRQLIEMKDNIEDELKGIKTDILGAMETLNVKSWCSVGGMRLTRKLPTTRSSFNLELFKKDYPDLDYSKYMKQSEVSGSLQIVI